MRRTVSRAPKPVRRMIAWVARREPARAATTSNCSASATIANSAPSTASGAYAQRSALYAEPSNAVSTSRTTPVRTPAARSWSIAPSGGSRTNSTDTGNGCVRLHHAAVDDEHHRAARLAGEELGRLDDRERDRLGTARQLDRHDVADGGVRPDGDGRGRERGTAAQPRGRSTRRATGRRRRREDGRPMGTSPGRHPRGRTTGRRAGREPCSARLVRSLQSSGTTGGSYTLIARSAPTYTSAFSTS